MAPGPDASAEFDRYVVSRRAAMLRSAWLLTGDNGKAEDLVQTVLTRLWLHWARVSRFEELDAYVQTMIYRLYLTWWRRRWRAEVPAGTLPEPTEGHDPTELATVREVVRSRLALLTSKQRAVVVLRFVEERSVDETATILRCSPGTVKTHTSRALHMLRKDPVMRDLVTQEVEA